MSAGASIDPGAVRAPRRALDVAAAVLGWVPRPVADAVFATGAILDGVLRNGRFMRVRAWAHARGVRGPAGQWLALRTLANHGRFVVDELLLPTAPATALAAGSVLEGHHHLAALDARGAVLLMFHLGPPGAWRTLRTHGYRVHSAIRSATVLRRGAVERAVDEGVVVGLDEGGPSARVGAMLRLRNLIAQGALVALAADGPFGDEAFRLQVAGAPLLVRGGWLALRRALKVPVLPVLSHRGDDGRLHVVVHAPLPAPAADVVQDQRMLGDRLTALLEGYVTAHPSQCRWLAAPYWSTAVPDGGGRPHESSRLDETP